MAVADVSAANQDAVGPLLKRFQDMVGRYGRGTHYPDKAYVRGILHATDAGQVGGAIGTPVADKGDYFRLKLLAGHDFLLWRLFQEHNAISISA